MEIVTEDILLEIIFMFEEIMMICGVFCIPIAKQKRFFFYGGILFLVLCLGHIWIWEDDFVILTMRMCMVPVIILLWTKGKIIRRLAIYICSTMYLHMPYLCINLVCAGISGKPITELKAYVAYQSIRGILTCIIIGLLAYRLRKISGYKELINNLQTKYFLVGGVCSLAASVVQHFIEEASLVTYYDMELVICIIICMVIVSTMFYALGVGFVVMDLLRQKYKAESSLKDEYLQITREYVRVVRRNARETRKMRHDLQAHISSLRHYMEKKEYRKAESYLSAIQDHMTQTICKTVSVNHEIVDAVLLEAQSRGEPYQIQWKIEGILPSALSIGDFELCTIFSNLLSNSIEACERLPQSQRQIHLEIRQLENNLVIELANPVRDRIDLERLGSVTTKEDEKNHGFGISNIRTMVEKNHGRLFFEEQEGIFLAKILFLM